MASRLQLAYTARMRPSPLLLAACLPFILYSSASLSASIYRWVDSSGLVHYTQSPPEHGSYTPVHPNVPPATSAPGVSSMAKLSESYDANNAAQSKAREAALKTKADRAEQCAKAQQRINQLQTATAHRLFVEGADGQRQRMTQPEFEKLLKQAQARADASCNN